MGVSHQLISRWEARSATPTVVQLAMWGAVVGLDVTIRSFPAGPPLRDAGQLRVLARARTFIGQGWHWRTEAPVTDDPLDRRAIDAVISRGNVRIGLEVITRLTDAQAQVRAATLKQEASGLNRMILVLADTRHNRRAMRDAEPSLAPAFPCEPRVVTEALRAGGLPPSNGIVFA
jgi:hypothetical protein